MQINRSKGDHSKLNCTVYVQWKPFFPMPTRGFHRGYPFALFCFACACLLGGCMYACVCTLQPLVLEPLGRVSAWVVRKNHGSGVGSGGVFVGR